jgi:hypothetical protein
MKHKRKPSQKTYPLSTINASVNRSKVDDLAKAVEEHINATHPNYYTNLSKSELDTFSHSGVVPPVIVGNPPRFKIPTPELTLPDFISVVKSDDLHHDHILTDSLSQITNANLWSTHNTLATHPRQCGKTLRTSLQLKLLSHCVREMCGVKYSIPTPPNSQRSVWGEK